MPASAVDCKTQPLFPPGTCPKCGSHRHELAPGSGPHFARVQCGGCGAFVRWAPKPPHISLTAAQKGYLRELGHAGPLPATQEEGRRLIVQYLTGQRW